jgi:putative DNA-invertase from lambdoid prophage Rac
MGVYGYTRVSTDKQANEGESLGAQKRTLGSPREQGGARHAALHEHLGHREAQHHRVALDGAKLLAALKPGRRRHHPQARPHVQVRPQCSRR